MLGVSFEEAGSKGPAHCGCCRKRSECGWFRGQGEFGRPPWVAFGDCAKDELVEVGLELGAGDPVMSADEPLLEVADGAIGEWHHRRRALAQFGSQRLSARDVLEAEFLQASKAFEAIGMNGRARSDVLRDEAV